MTITKEQAQREAIFLKGWARKKPIIRHIDLYEDRSCYYRAGKWMTKVPNAMRDAMVKHGYATEDGVILKINV